MTRAASARPRTLARLVAALRDRGLDPSEALTSIAHVVADRCAPGVDLHGAGALLDGSIPFQALTGVDIPDELIRPELLGDVLEQLHDRDARRRQGSFFTPHVAAALVVERMTDGWPWPNRPRVCDPACGGGAFLLAAGRLLVEHGLRPAEIVSDLLWGIDTDGVSVATTQATLALWAATHGDAAPVAHVVEGDALVAGVDCFGDEVELFDLVVGNPPFQSQLAASTARTREQARVLEARFGSVSRAYADSSTLFMVATAAMTRAGGRCALILPESFLAARDAAPARAHLLDRGRLVGLWVPVDPMFSASVRVCVPILEVGSSADTTIRRWAGPTAMPAAEYRVDGRGLGVTWAELTADLLGVPSVDVPHDSALGSMAQATAGFRDQFYGLQPFVRERNERDVDPVRLVTSGGIDLVNDLSSHRPTTFARTTYTAPVVDMELLCREAPDLGRWAARVLVPKVMVATQTRVVEVLVDETGRDWPSVPVIAVIAPAERLWHVAAVLASPPASALGLRRHAGAALTRDALKLSAKQVLALPLPADAPAWDRGADHLRSASMCAQVRDGDGWARELHAFGTAMCEAYGASNDVLDWWERRLTSLR